MSYLAVGSKISGNVNLGIGNYSLTLVDFEVTSYRSIRAYPFGAPPAAPNSLSLDWFPSGGFEAINFSKGPASGSLGSASGGDGTVDFRIFELVTPGGGFRIDYNKPDPQSETLPNSGSENQNNPSDGTVALDKFVVHDLTPAEKEAAARLEALLNRLRADTNYFGSDEWRDAHTTPSHWKGSVLKGLAADAVNRVIANPTSPHAAGLQAGAAAAQSDYQMEQDRLFAIEENQRVQSGKAL